MNLAKPVKNKKIKNEKKRKKYSKQIKMKYDTHIYNKQSKSKDREHF